MATDAQKTMMVIDEHGKAAGGAVTEQAIMNLLRTLMAKHGENYSIAKAQVALDDLIANAQQYKKDLAT